MSIITTFPGIRSSVVYPFCYEIDHLYFAILSLFRFGDHVLFSLRSRRLWKWWAQERTGHARETRVSPRAPVLYRALLRSACYKAICLIVFPLYHREPPLLYVNLEIKSKIKSYLFCSCTKIKSAGIKWTFGPWGGVRARNRAPVHSSVVKNKRINVCGETIHV